MVGRNREGHRIKGLESSEGGVDGLWEDVEVFVQVEEGKLTVLNILKVLHRKVGM